MITLTREEAQQVLKTITLAKGYIFHNVLDDKENPYDKTIELLRAKLSKPDVMINGLTEQETNETMSVKGLSEPEPEPVAWLYRGDGMKQVLLKRNDHFFSLDEETFIKGEPLYTAPPQREWQGLTDDEINDAWGNNLSFARAIEAKLKEKNSG